MPGIKRKSKNVVTSSKRARYQFAKSTLGGLENGIKLSNVTPMPQTLVSTLRYRDQLHTLNPGIGGTMAQHFWAANGLYDVDVTGTGHQPVGFDEIMAFYDHYGVRKAKITATFANQDNSNGQTVGIYVSDTNLTITDVRRVIENGQCAFTELNIGGREGDQKTLSFYVDIEKFMNRKVKNDDTLQGNDSTNPSDIVYFVTFAQPQAAVDSSNVGVQVTIEFITTFMERKRNNLS